MYNEIEKLSESQILTLKDREKFTVGLVENVESFSDEEIELCTSLGMLTVSGHGLKLEDLSVQSGNISLTGKIDKMVFSKSREKRSFLRDLFK